MSRRSSGTVVQKEMALPLMEAGPTRMDSTVSSSSSSTNTSKSYPKISDLPPPGQFMFSAMWEGDPTPSFVKGLCCVATVLGLIALLFMTNLIQRLFPSMDFSWDDRNGISTTSGSPFMALMESSLGLSPTAVQIILGATLIGYLGGFILAGILLGMTSNGKDPTYPWPSPWNTNNYLCYHDMFSEPTRHGRLLRRPGNTLSNASYVLAALAVFGSSLVSNKPNLFWIADTEFAVMLFILSICSTLWHGSNAPWSQYPDLWSMDCCILYLLIRYSGLAGICLLQPYVGPETAQWWAATLVALTYSTIIVTVGTLYWEQFHKGWLHGKCPLSVRARLSGTSNIAIGQGHHDVYIGSTLCAFAALPVCYLSLPTAIQLGLVGSLGSITAANWAFRTLVIGWSYRMWERFILDGNVLMNYFVDLKPSWTQTVGAALFSPTAHLHAWTGITLLAGYMHCRSVEGEGMLRH